MGSVPEAERDRALRVLLAQHPEAMVGAINSNATRGELPASLPLNGQCERQGQTPEAVVPADVPVVIRCFEEALASGAAS